MILLCSVMGAVMTAILIQLALAVLEPHYKLQLVHWKYLILSKSVMLISAATSAVVFGMICFRWEANSVLELVLHVILLWGLAVLSVIDYKCKLVPNKLVLLLLTLWALAIAVSIFQDMEAGVILLIECITGGIMGGVIFGACYLLSKKQLGAGDVKLAFVMGLFLTGSSAIQAYLCGSILCCLYCIVQIIRKKLSWKDSIPMVPFLTAGVWVTLLFVK